MHFHKLPNYLRLHRKRLGLSLSEVAFLVGWGGSAQPSRYEHFARRPGLRTALALAAILQVSVHELFAGDYQKVRTTIALRAQRLEERITRQNPDRRTARKLALLKLLISRDDNRSQNR